ncbi:MAG: PAS domain S-box protein, partial [Candidatus Cloacimonetes bacterium]|nr:PAS domain S-box protein [Candidatus Cloacimonadota bacterium]
ISGKYTSWNRASEDMFGFTAEEVIGKLTPGRFHCNDKEAKTVIDTVDREGKFDDEITLIRKDGSEFPARLLVSKTIDTTGKHIGYTGVAVDITERKQAEKVLAEKELQFHSLSDASMEGIGIIQDGKVVVANKKACELFDYNQNEIVGKPLLEFVAIESKELTLKNFEEKYKKPFELVAIRKDGSEFRAEVCGKSIEFKGHSARVVAIRDITERKQAEETQIVLYNIANAVNTTKNLDELYKIIHKELGKVIDTTNFYIADYNEETGEIIASYFVDEMFDVKPPIKLRAKGFTAYMIRNKKSLFLTEERLKKLIELGEIDDREWKSKSWLGVPLIIENRVVGALAVLSYRQESLYTKKDLSLLEFIADAIAIGIARKQADESIRESEARYRNIFELIPNPVVIHSEGKVVAGNKAALKFSKAENPEEFIGSPVINFVHPDYREKAAKRIRKIMKEKVPAGLIEEKFINTKNEIRDVEVAAVPTKFENKDSVLVAFRDITYRKQSELVQLVLYNIAKTVNTSKNLDELYHTIHQHLSTVIDTTNFYIALYDEDKNVISFPYYIDEKDAKPEPVPKKLSKGLTEYVLRTGKSLLATKEYYMKLAKEGKIEISGSISEVWLGIPMRYEKKIIGVIALQSYKDASIYNEKDVEILELISYQIAIAIEKKNTEQINLHLSEIIRNARDGMILTSPEGQITYINSAFEKMSGYKLSELLNTDPANLIVSEDTTAIAKEIRSAVKTKDEWRGELLCIRKNGEIYPIDTRVFAIKNAKDELVEIAAIQQDITERKKAQKTQLVLYNIAKAINTTKDLHALFVSIKEYLSKIIDTTNFYIAFFDEKTNIISLPYVVDEKDKFTSFPAGKTITAHVINTGKPLLATEKVLKKLVHSGEVKIHGTTPKIWLGVPLKIEDKVTGIVAVHSYTNPSLYTEKDIEILEFVADEIALSIIHKQAEEALLESEEKYHTLIDSIQDGVFFIQDGFMKLVNPAFASMIGYKEKEVIGMDFRKLVAPEDVEMVAERYRRRQAGEDILSKYEFRMLCKDGKTRVDVFMSVGIINFKGKAVSIGTVHDITKRKQTEKKLESLYKKSEESRKSLLSILEDITKKEAALLVSQERFQDIVTNSGDWIWETDEKGRYTYCSPVVKQVLGYVPEEVLGKHFYDFFHPAERDKLKETAFEVFKKKGKFHDLVNRNVHKDGRVIFLETNAVPLLDDKGNLLGYRGVDRDTTERIQAENIQRALYDISNALNTTDKMHDLYSKIREYLGNVIDTTNFYVALYDEKTNMISLPFDIDEKDDYETFPTGKTLTSYVIKTGKPLFAPKQLQDEL